MTDTSWPSHAPGTRARLAAGHAAGPNATSRTPTTAERRQAEAIRAAIARGEPVTPGMRLTLGLYDATTATRKENDQ